MLDVDKEYIDENADTQTQINIIAAQVKKEDLVAVLKTNKIPSTAKTSSKASMITLMLNHADQGDTLADEGE